MWKELKNTVVRSTQAVARGFRWWVEKFGENPSFSRDPGIAAWQAFAGQRPPEDDADLPAGELASKDGADDGTAGGSDQHPRRLPLQPRRAALLSGRRLSWRRSLAALHRPAFVSVRLATRRAVRITYRWDLGA